MRLVPRCLSGKVKGFRLCERVADVACGDWRCLCGAVLHGWNMRQSGLERNHYLQKICGAAAGVPVINSPRTRCIRRANSRNFIFTGALSVRGVGMAPATKSSLSGGGGCSSLDRRS